jgi:hypothetical protein
LASHKNEPQTVCSGNNRLVLQRLKQSLRSEAVSRLLLGVQEHFGNSILQRRSAVVGVPGTWSLFSNTARRWRPFRYTAECDSRTGDEFAAVRRWWPNHFEDVAQLVMTLGINCKPALWHNKPVMCEHDLRTCSLGRSAGRVRSNAGGACACDWCLILQVAEFHTLKHDMVQTIAQHAPGDDADVACFFSRGIDDRHGYGSGAAYCYQRHMPNGEANAAVAIPVRVRCS